VEVRSGVTLRLEVGTERIEVAHLDLHAGARIDVGYGGFQVAPGQSSEAAIRQAILSARAGGAWNGLGIGSARAGGDRVVGYRHLANGAIVVAWAAPGDANMDGRVNFSDLSLILDSGRYGSAGGWWQGDFNYDGLVNFSDMGLLISAGLFNVGSYTEGVAEPRRMAVQIHTDAGADAGTPTDVPDSASLATVPPERPWSVLASEPSRPAVGDRQLLIQVLAAAISLEPAGSDETTVRRRARFRATP
jgi:hypothetical protein